MSDINEFVLNRLDKIEDKVDCVGDKLSEQMATQNRLLGEYNQSLREHMRRTQILENKVEPMHELYEEKIVADKIFSKKWKKISIIIGTIATAVGILTGIASLLGMI